MVLTSERTEDSLASFITEIPCLGESEDTFSATVSQPM